MPKNVTIKIQKKPSSLTKYVWGLILNHDFIHGAILNAEPNFASRFFEIFLFASKNKQAVLGKTRLKVIYLMCIK